MTSRKRIAFIDLLFHWPPRGGSWVDVKEVAAGYARQGHEVTLFVPDFARFFPRGEIRGELPFTVKRLPFDYFSFNRRNVPKTFLREMRAFKPDRVFLTDGYFLKPLVLNALAEFPVVLRFYGYELICPRMNFFSPLANGFCDNTFLKDPRYCVKCFTHSHRYLKFAIKSLFGIGCSVATHFEHEFVFAGTYRKEYPSLLADALGRAHTIVVYNERMKGYLSPYNADVRVVPSGVDIDRFRPTTATQKEKTALFMPGRATDEMKGLPVILRHLDRLYEKRQDFELYVTGEEPMTFGQEYVRYAGWLSQEDLPKMYAKSDICIAPSIWDEPFGITPLEAMASARPVVAAARGGLQHTVSEGNNGFLFDPDDGDEFIQKMELLLDSAETRKKMGDFGRATVVENYSWAKIMEKFYTPILLKQ